ncbi:MAG: DUF2306 domain-containing protein [Leptothrix ochracea]|uniref:DUF2306 domain-containing protein n=1 Tax=Leptothrix ochracea TaxID=735331 RepID=UPI0034E1C783
MHNPSVISPLDLPWVILVHLMLAVGALLLGPFTLRARKGSGLHRSSGYVWIMLMLGAALSSAFIRDRHLPNIAGYTPIHVLTVLTLVGVSSGLWHIRQRRITAHRQTMWRVYLSGCIGAGAFTLLPGRYLGNLLWHHTLGWV